MPELRPSRPNSRQGQIPASDALEGAKKDRDLRQTSPELRAESILGLFDPAARRTYVTLDLTLKSMHLRRFGLPSVLLLKQRARRLPELSLELPDLNLEFGHLCGVRILDSRQHGFSFRQSTLQLRQLPGKTTGLRTALADHPVDQGHELRDEKTVRDI